MKFWGYFIIGAMFIPNHVIAGGLLGDAINLVAPGVGTALDDEHRKFKDRFQVYKDVEEGGSKLVRDAVTVTCTIPYQTITNAVIAKCSNWDGRLDGQDTIQRAADILIQSGIISAHEFNGIQVRWCPLDNAEGIAPDRGRIYLNTSNKGAGPIELASLLAHEMTHVRQYRQLGTDKFKCEYSREFIECGGCQDNGNDFEREAYDFENRTYQHLSRLSSQQQPQAYPQFAYQPPVYRNFTCYSTSAYGGGWYWVHSDLQFAQSQVLNACMQSGAPGCRVTGCM